MCIRDRLLPPTILKRGGIGVLITDENVEPLYCEQVEQALRICGFHVLKAVVPSGEEAKSGEDVYKRQTYGRYRRFVTIG